MPRRPITKDQWDRIVGAFRMDPGNVAAAHKLVPELCYRTIRRAWELGISWAEFPEAHEPISKMFEGENERQRVALVRQESSKEAIRQDAQRDAAQTRIAEAQMSRLARANATALLAAVTGLAPAVREVTQAMEASVKELAYPVDSEGKPRKHTSAEVKSWIQLLHRLSSVEKQLVESSREAVEVERLILGEPTQILGVIHKAEDISPEEAQKRMEAAMRAFERARQQGLFGASPKVIEAKLEPKKTGT